ncbi:MULTISPECIES: bifunctional phosphopantothenoylcysteine decarboxylase/phosphopantothenate--cysteine ligase CoaBC [Aliiglaciecola]|uniref:bifunctional phosphopantothenoylcysteine decarboxylase/phosphopantothenate--cysteine ligase CoaBC n=1 Tax=Aliiglaciecola TaxID=1406885 RepID=UPI001C0A31BF|nr:MULTISPECIES: bifunctional phosphopantothenoylcysteine decarboxylase/phosphopantothenate--cysteine ligase CoaBC [Aliiglaciecola]MBU2879112.1 bifunctional phosphopantothenoylcysteine decarboxylase/phosphopantothenate--cysteine ligase CoaBC [Aliiglaciecola lipolytica]MDO6710810.1 bifunctional phosphopantothenoylcysteine decarboxylase/phosphopantothenate--cysteine ligase CoaBC [Aliiglaciecola sp. 2_MG-2023]MDO6751782.1 bifunctional phosphopantothenoylcysteine decarboxylase/phosphopantothenate--c
MAIQKHKVLLGITGGIAAYKTPDLIRKLTVKDAEVRAVLTASAEHFVSPLALQAVSGNPVSSDLLDPAAEAAMGHIELAKWADSILIAPATANFIAKLAHGMADDLLSTLCLASTAEVYISPAMNQQMWKADATQKNLSILSNRGVTIIPPDSGEQACGDIGQGRMPEPQYLADLITQPKPPQCLTGKKIVITAGPTREAIDPVRYISNHSSGKMGYALANAAIAMGAEVTLVSGPVNLSAPNKANLINVESAQQMHDAVMGNIQSADIFIGCAAVADYRPLEAVNQKIKKNNQELTLTFTKNPDILADVAKQQRSVFTVGFAAETQDVSRYAKEKLERKQLDMIAANDVSNSNIGFNSDQNALTVFWKEGEKSLDVADKKQLAFKLMQLVSEKYRNKHATK